MLIIHGTVATFDERGTLIEDGAIKTTGDRIIEIGPTAQLEQKYSDEERLDADGALVMPGLICAHTHFYGAFARGIPPRGGDPPADFSQILERLWWRLDRALRREDVSASVDACLVDAIRHGTTTLVDHHSSPACIEGSLDLLASRVLAAGLRACLSYEVSDRDGNDAAVAGLRENLRFIRRTQREKHPRLAGMMGLHASMTLSEDRLAEAAGFASDLAVGCHIHVAEDQADVEDCLKQYGLRVVERLQKAGVLAEHSFAIHCVHVDDYEVDMLREAGCRVIHNPRSNMNNAVGTARVPRMLRAGLKVGLGNDGFSNNMFNEMSVAYLIHKAATGDPRQMPADQVVQMAFRHNRWATRELFPAEVGILAPGAMADIILLNYHPPTPMTSANLPWHMILGMDGTAVQTTICAGRVLMRDGRLLSLDEPAISARARELAGKLWARY